MVIWVFCPIEEFASASDNSRTGRECFILHDFTGEIARRATSTQVRGRLSDDYSGVLGV